MDTSQYYTVREVADKLGVSRQRVHQLIAAYSISVESVRGLVTLIPKKELRKIPTKRNNTTRIRRQSENCS